jgi:NADPH2:quinone reductase
MSIPETMSFIHVAAPGGPDKLVLETGPVPKPAAGEVLIRVAAAGVNRVDCQQREGEYRTPPGVTQILGVEVAGEVAAVGPGVTRWQVGDKVCALVSGGGYAGYVAAPEGQCLPWPKGFDAVNAAALPQTYLTVWSSLFGYGRFKAGEAVLVHGGSSGIGTTAIQLAKAFGARAVYATAGSAEKCAACEQLGADAAINYREQDFVEAIKELTGGKGVDIVLDIVGGPYAARNLRCLDMRGRLVMIAFLQGSKVDEFDFGRIMAKHLTIVGSTLRPRSVAEKTALAAELHEKVWPLLEAGRCLPVIDSVLPLADAAEAHRRMEKSDHIGKIMLEVVQ